MEQEQVVEQREDWKITPRRIEQEVRDILVREGIEYLPEFVPAFRSTRKREEWTANGREIPFASWNIILKKGKRVFETPYFVGYGHYFKGNRWGNNATLFNAVKRAMETGRVPRNENTVFDAFTKTDPIKPPEAASVFYSLVLDAQAINFECFEDWAYDCGYETDSRKAEQVYRDCLSIALRLRGFLGEKLLAELAEVVREY